MKRITIPRLKLCAAVLTSQLVQVVRAISIFERADLSLWTDSEIVLYWLRKRSDELNIFVANRVTMILQNTEINQWHHVRSAENPADLVSRGMSVSDLLRAVLWWHGPNFLITDLMEWPLWKGNKADVVIQQAVESECKKVKRKKVQILSLTASNRTGHEFCLMNKISDYDRINCITAYVLRFCRLCYATIAKRKQANLLALGDAESASSNQCSELSIRESEAALQYWVRVSQMNDFPEEYSQISNGRAISTEVNYGNYRHF